MVLHESHINTPLILRGNRQDPRWIIQEETVPGDTEDSAVVRFLLGI